ncbi:MAG: HAMP domain-containing histidine kinase [Desulfobacterota bacterium]|nr:HAMP domain-containing histidine kinase [Thermodesulfobacteriota bacterium]
MNLKEHLFDLLIHDLRGPLSIASTCAHNLLHKSERYGPLTNQQKRTLGVVLRNIRKSQALVQQMVQLLLSEEKLFHHRPFFIHEALKDSLAEALETLLPEEAFSEIQEDQEFFRMLQEHGIQIALTGKYCTAPFCHDPDKVRQILINLISNALKYRRSRMNVSISGEDDLIVSVEDDGPGIPCGKEEAIFERFSKIGGGEKPEIPGLGLGLIGVKVLVEAMGGEIRFVSLKDKGTCFTVRIPCIALGRGGEEGRKD